MFECLCSFPLVSHDIKDKFFSVHLCEAPVRECFMVIYVLILTHLHFQGAFISCLNHYLQLHHPEVEFDYRATTLNPYYEGNSLSNTILDDRFILHTLPKWFFGENYNGDILDKDNIKSLIDHCKSSGCSPQLVTGDGSIDRLVRLKVAY